MLPPPLAVVMVSLPWSTKAVPKVSSDMPLLVMPPFRLIELPLIMSAAVPALKEIPPTKKPAVKLFVRVAAEVLAKTQESPLVGFVALLLELVQRPTALERLLVERLLVQLSILCARASGAAMKSPRERVSRAKLRQVVEAALKPLNRFERRSKRWAVRSP